MATAIEIITEKLKDNPYVTVLHFKGELDETNVEQQAKVVYDVINGMPYDAFLVLDFEELEYMKSTSIGYITDWQTEMGKRDGQVVIVRTKEHILDLLNVVGLTQIIKTYDTLEEAEDLFSKKKAV